MYQSRGLSETKDPFFPVYQRGKINYCFQFYSRTSKLRDFQGNVIILPSLHRMLALLESLLSPKYHIKSSILKIHVNPR